jgi:hypothetical protein
MERKNKSTKRWRKWLRKYRVVLLDETSFEERFSIVLSRFNVFLVVGTLSVLLIVGTIIMIAYTPLREYIPGYMSSSLRQNAFKLDQKTDSLLTQMAYQEAFIQRIQLVLNDELPVDSLGSASTPAGWTPENLKPSERELALRDEVAAMDAAAQSNEGTDKELYLPLAGELVSVQRISQREFGIKIAGEEEDPVSSMKDGTVLSIEGSSSVGFSVSIQHPGGGLSRYANLSKTNTRIGDYVHQGDVIGFLGDSQQGGAPYVIIQYWLGGESLNLQELLGY